MEGGMIWLVTIGIIVALATLALMAAVIARRKRRTRTGKREVLRK